MPREQKRRSALDPAVQSVLGDDPLYGRMAKDRQMTAAQRKRAKADRERNRVSIDISKQMQAVVDQIGAADGLNRTQVICWLIALGLDHFDRGTMVDAKVPTKSMRWEFVLDIPEVELPEEYR